MEVTAKRRRLTLDLVGVKRASDAALAKIMKLLAEVEIEPLSEKQLQSTIAREF